MADGETDECVSTKPFPSCTTIVKKGSSARGARAPRSSSAILCSNGLDIHAWIANFRAASVYNPLDGRKGQFLAVSALAVFEGKRQQDPERYRDVSLTLLSVGDDYVARQLKAIGSSLLGEHFTALRSSPHEDALALARTCNVTICCSINESFGLYVAEGMLMGHVILRNNSAGRAEQLVEGVNGLLITDDVTRSLCISQRFLGTREIILLHHTDCGLQKVDEEEFKRELETEVGVKPAWALESFNDPFLDTKQSIRRIQMSPFVLHKDNVRGFVYDVDSGQLHEVQP